ncbi:VOC family protein [Companilactobacillus sp.]|uniref:VOC family protein n=1 Tax=Companilactobacillus sp. TaxID=2767905 RepID=UPI002636A32A|nr:VOC family protein [Companilactobacillus sp.]
MTIKKFELMLYVKNVETIADFMENALDAKRLDKTDLPDNSSTIKLAILDQVNVNLFNIDFITKYSPSVSIEFPSIMLMTDDIEALYQQVQKYTDKISPITSRGEEKTFNFADPEDNYYAIGNM